MNPLTLEWVTKAEADFATAGREIKVRKSPNFDAICFHSQQTIEKYLKAFLQEKGGIVPRTHVLIDLLGLRVKIDPSFQILQTDLNILEGYAVQFRYPGQSANRIDAQNAFKTTSIAREFLRRKLGLED